MQRRRIRLTVRYDGRDFAGSQLQPDKRTVAGTLKSELEAILAAPVHLLFASRTDSGVHADGNVCAFDAAPPFPCERFPYVLNSRLPWDLEVRDGREMPVEFHPRFDAVSRTYIYRVYRGADVPVDRRMHVACHQGKWDSAKISAALQLICGNHSFSNFSKGNDDPDDCICDLKPVEMIETGAEVWWIFTANRFLRHMVVRLAGALLSVATEETRPEVLGSYLAGQMEVKLKPAPVKGLTLQSVEYPEKV